MRPGSRVIASLGAGPQERLLRLARLTIEPYARRHGYELALHTQVVDPSRPAPWSKIRILRELVDRYEVVVWLDADLVVVDGRVDIASELRDGCFLHLVEHQVGGGAMPNTGVMLLRGGERSAEFLDAVWELDDYTDHRWWENAAVCHLLGYELDPPRIVRGSQWRDETAILSPRWNSITDAPAKHAYIRHFPGFKTRTRLALMAAATAEAGARRVARRG